MRLHKALNVQNFEIRKTNTRIKTFVLFSEITSFFLLRESMNSFQLFSKRQILDPSKLKEFSDDNFKFDKKGRKFFKQVENTAGKGEIARYE